MNHFLTHISLPVQIYMILCTAWTTFEIVMFLRNKHKNKK